MAESNGRNSKAHPKLIEVALPLDAINAAAAREKSIRHGHPSTLHLWWARRPLAACRAVLFASLVDDPSGYMPDADAADRERQRLFRIIERLVPWEASQDENVIAEARLEIARSLERGGAPALSTKPDSAEVNAYLAKHAPPVLDPFCGGGSIPLEAQRLGLEAHGSDLNPVAVLITKALIEIPPRFVGQPPVNPEARKNPLRGGAWKGAHGLVADVRFYGEWMRQEAETRLGWLYPKVKLPKEHGGGEATVIAWLWARTVTCPNPACGCEMPLIRSFVLSRKKGKETWIEPVVRKGKPPRIEFRVMNGEGQPPDGTVKGRRGAKCLACAQPVSLEFIRNEGRTKRMGAQMTAIVAEGRGGRIYVRPDPGHETQAREAPPSKWLPVGEVPRKLTGGVCSTYGLTQWSDLFTPRQLVAMTTFSDLVGETMKQIERGAVDAGFRDDNVPLREGGRGAQAYAEAVGTYLAFCVSALADRNSTLCTWDPGGAGWGEKTRNTFSRQAMPMTWDYAEVNPLSKQTGSFNNTHDYSAKALNGVVWLPAPAGFSVQNDARIPASHAAMCFATDPPYYDNIGYADLSDFFYVWLRRSIGSRAWPELFSTLVTPKDGELIASPHRHAGNKDEARRFFEDGLRQSFTAMRRVHDERFPLCVFYAFKQSESPADETDDELGEPETRVDSGSVSTGWETMLEGLLDSGCSIHGTWPMRSELGNRMTAKGTNALASSILLVCRRKDIHAPRCGRRDFIMCLRRELPNALHKLQASNIAAVDLAQAAIGPGMAIFTRYACVLEEDGQPMRVRTALALINQSLDEILAEQDGSYDAETRWAIAWFEQHGFDEGKYGEAETLARAKNTVMGRLDSAGIVKSRAGRVRLAEMDTSENESGDDWHTAWQITHGLMQIMESHGNDGAAQCVRRVGAKVESSRDLAYRLYMVCERKKWAQSGHRYNGLVVAWNDILKLSTMETPEKLPFTASTPQRAAKSKTRSTRAPQGTRRAAAAKRR